MLIWLFKFIACAIPTKMTLCDFQHNLRSFFLYHIQMSHNIFHMPTRQIPGNWTSFCLAKILFSAWVLTHVSIQTLLNWLCSLTWTSLVSFYESLRFHNKKKISAHDEHVVCVCDGFSWNSFSHRLSLSNEFTYFPRPDVFVIMLRLWKFFFSSRKNPPKNLFQSFRFSCVSWTQLFCFDKLRSIRKF